MRKVIMALALVASLFLGLFVTASPAAASTVNEMGHNATVVIDGALDWRFTTIWETNYNASIPTTTEPTDLYLCQLGTVGVKKKAKSARVSWQNGRTGATLTKITLNATSPDSSCPALDSMGDMRPYFADIKVSDWPTLNIDFYDGTGLTGTRIGIIRGYEYQ